MDSRFAFFWNDYLVYEKHCVKNRKIVLPEKKVISQKHDKIFKQILEDKKEMSKFLRNYLDIRLEPEDLIAYSNEFVDEDYKRNIADIIYKEKDREVYYIIEHQSKIDPQMPFRILCYCVLLMRKVIKNRKKNSRYPIIVPIVLHTGTRPWNVTTNFAQRYEESDDPYEPYKIEMKYKLVDVNRYTNLQLISTETLLSCVMLMEKAKNKEELLEIVKEILDNLKSIKLLPKIRQYLIDMQEGRTELKEMIEIINEREKEGKDKMSTLCDRLRYENEVIRKKAREQGVKEGIKEGIKEAIISLVKNMLRQNEEEDKILTYANIKKEELEKIKEELQIKIKKN